MARRSGYGVSAVLDAATDEQLHHNTKHERAPHSSQDWRCHDEWSDD